MAAREIAENTLPETTMKYGLLGVALASSFLALEAMTSLATAVFITQAGLMVGLGGVAIWGIRQIGKLFKPKQKAA